MNCMKITIRKILKNLVNLINNNSIIKMFFEGLKDLLHINEIIHQVVMQFDK